MNRSIRQLAIGLMVCFTALFVQLNYIQVFRAESLNEHPANTRQVVADFNQPRGRIEAADGTVLAFTEDVDGTLTKQRVYPGGELFAPFTGFYSFHYGAEGVEREYNDALIGDISAGVIGDLTEIFQERTPEERVANLRLTVEPDLQQVAADALGDRRGSVVVLDPSTGAVRAMWSNPSFDPNQMSLLNRSDAAEARQALLDDPANPLLVKAYRERYFPGSTFKMVTAAAALTEGVVGLDDERFPPVRDYVPPKTSVPLQNFGGSACGGTLIELLRQSCNTGIAEIAAERLGPPAMIEMAEAFAFNTEIPFDLPNPVVSNFPTEYGAALEPPDSTALGTIFENTPALAQASIGQNEVQASPLHMALVAAAIANNGVLPNPHVLSEVVDNSGQQLKAGPAGSWRRAIEPSEARQLQQAMRVVVADGTAKPMSIDGLSVGAKTGTAQLGAAETSTHAWVIGFAGPEGGTPSAAISVLVEAVPGGPQQTGGFVAAPIAAEVLREAVPG